MLGRVCGLSGALLLAAGMAQAATVDLTFQVSGQSFGNEGLSQTVTISTPNDPSFQDGGLYDGNAGAGMFQLNGGETLGDFAAFCVELAQALQPGTYTLTSDLFSGRVLANIDRLFSSTYAEVDTSLEASAFQVALWEIIHDDAESFDLAAGNVIITGNEAVTTEATAYLNGLSTASTGAYELGFLSNPNSQDVVLARWLIEEPEAAPPAVPLPATGLFLLGGIGGLAALRRRARNA